VERTSLGGIATKRWVGTLVGFAAGLVAATSGFAFAQGYLGVSTLTINGKAYPGTFTPQESANDLLVPISQLAAAMGFQYAWTGNTLAITTGKGATSGAGAVAATGPVQLAVSVVNATAPIQPNLEEEPSTSVATLFRVGFTFKGSPTFERGYPVQLTIAGLTPSDISVWWNYNANWVQLKLTGGAVTLPGADFSALVTTTKTQVFAVEGVAPGIVTVTASVPTDTSIAPQSESFTFSQ